MSGFLPGVVGFLPVMSSALYVLLLFSALWTLSLCGTRQFHLVNENKTWTGAQSYCRANFTDLATIESQQEMDAVKAALNMKQGLKWIGLKQKDPADNTEKGRSWGSREKALSVVHQDRLAPGKTVERKTVCAVYDQSVEMSWIWSDGSNSSYRYWNTGEPNGADELCVELWYEPEYRWNDAVCGLVKPFICYEVLQWAWVSVTTTTTMVRYLAPIEEEQDEYCQSPTAMNVSDQTNRNRPHEGGLRARRLVEGPVLTAQHCRPRLAFAIEHQNWQICHRRPVLFTDVTGSGDAVENVMPPATSFSMTGLVVAKELPLILINQNKTWREALRYCRDNHVDLVSIHNATIQRWVDTAANYASTANVWVGLRHTCAQGFWYWVSGSTMCYQNWAPGHGTGVEDCSGGERTGAVQSRSKQWVSLPETQTLNFICSLTEVMSSALYVLLLFSALWTLSLCGTRHFHLVNEQKSWTEARTYCRASFTDLATIESQQEMDAVKAILNMNQGLIWIGLNQKDPADKTDGKFNVLLLIVKSGLFQMGEWVVVKTVMSSALYVLLLFSALWTLSLCGTHHFHLVNEQKTWTGAQSYCRANFTDLATIESQQEMNALIAVVNGRGGNNSWIGLRQKQSVTSWIWSDGSNSTYRYWNTGEPNNGVGDMCGELWKSPEYRWNDSPCSYSEPFICYEVLPLILINQNKTWREALRYCRENHVDLVSVHTEEVQRWVEAAVNYASTANVWVGLRHTCTQGVWFWVSGWTICYQNWAPGNGTGVEDCSGGERTGAVQSGSKQWVSLPETQTLNFICSLTEAAGTGRLVAIEGKMNAAKYRDILEESLYQSALDLRLGRRFTFQQDNDPKYTVKITKAWLQNNSVTILDWPSQSPGLNPIQHLWRDLEIHKYSRVLVAVFSGVVGFW
ncbi:hypothetical protein NFI96_005192 [Prochilodus magdalenae]|nr:hypothetical protein NFI96_005192 [Prochilodus magdalenae]